MTQRCLPPNLIVSHQASSFLLYLWPFLRPIYQLTHLTKGWTLLSTNMYQPTLRITWLRVELRPSTTILGTRKHHPGVAPWLHHSKTPSSPSPQQLGLCQGLRWVLAPKIFVHSCLERCFTWGNTFVNGAQPIGPKHPAFRLRFGSEFKSYLGISMYECMSARLTV